MKHDMHRFAMEWNELHEKICDVVILPNGERQFMPSATKMYDVLIAPNSSNEVPSAPGREPAVSDQRNTHN